MSRYGFVCRRPAWWPCLLLIVLAGGCHGADEKEPALTVDEVYERFNLRTIRSSLGPRLKHHCERYFADLLPEAVLERESAQRMVVTADRDSWTIAVTAADRISIETVAGDGTYRAANVHTVRFDPRRGEWRGDGEEISIRPGCVPVAGRAVDEVAFPRGTAWQVEAGRVLSVAGAAAEENLVELFDMANAWGWDGKLVVRGHRLAKDRAACQANDRGACVGEASFLAAIDLASGRTERIDERPLTGAGPGPLRPVARSRLSNGHLLEQHGRHKPRIAVTRLGDGHRWVSRELNYKVEDFAVVGSDLVVAYREDARKYGVRAIAMDRMRQGGFNPRGRPLLTDRAVYTFGATFSKKDGPSVTKVQEWTPAGEKSRLISGSWSYTRRDCEPRDDVRLAHGDRYIVLLDGCGFARGVDLDAGQLFELSDELGSLFDSPSYTLLDDVLTVSSPASDRAYLFDLAERAWRGEVRGGAQRIVPVAGTQNAAVFVRDGRCVNDYANDADPTLPQSAHSIEGVRFVRGGADAQAPVPIAREEGPSRSDALRGFAALGQPAQVASADAGRSEPDSVGEFRLKRSAAARNARQRLAGFMEPRSLEGFACEVFRVPVHEKPGAAAAGWLYAQVRRGQGDAGAIDLWLVDDEGRPRPTMPVALVHRARLDPTLFVFDSAGDAWWNLSSTRDEPLWIEASRLPEAIRRSYRSRDEVIAAEYHDD